MLSERCGKDRASRRRNQAGIMSRPVAVGGSVSRRMLSKKKKFKLIKEIRVYYNLFY